MHLPHQVYSTVGIQPMNHIQVLPSQESNQWFIVKASKRWSVIATHLPKRTDNEIKNYWNTRIKKTLTKSGIDPITHKRIITHSGVLLGSGQTKDASNLNHMAQWETARLEAEARLTRHSKALSDKYDPYQVQHEHSNSSARDQLVGMPALVSPLPQTQRPICLDVLNVWQRIMSSNGAFDGSVEYYYSPASTFSFVDSAALIRPSGQTASISNFLDNDALSNYPIHIDQCTSTINCANSSACDQSMISVKQNIQNDSKILKPSKPDLLDIKEMMENPIKLHYRDEMTNRVSCLIGSLAE